MEEPEFSKPCHGKQCLWYTKPKETWLENGCVMWHEKGQQMADDTFLQSCQGIWILFQMKWESNVWLSSIRFCPDDTVFWEVQFHTIAI